MALTCPDCGATLRCEEFHGLNLDECRTCGGVWLDKGEMLQLRHLKSEEIRELEEEVAPPPERLPARSHEPKCPVCGEPLRPFHYAGGKIQLQTCDRLCGVWVEDKELDQIAAMQNVPLEAAQIVNQYEAESQAFVNRMDRFGLLMKFLDLHRVWPFFWPVPQP